MPAATARLPSPPRRFRHRDRQSACSLDRPPWSSPNFPSQQTSAGAGSFPGETGYIDRDDAGAFGASVRETASLRRSDLLLIYSPHVPNKSVVGQVATRPAAVQSERSMSSQNADASRGSELKVTTQLCPMA